MGKMIGAFLFPHPPLMIEEIGGQEIIKIESTIKGVREAASRIEVLKPDTIIVITPHGSLFEDAMSILFDERLKGSLAKFGAQNVTFDYKNDIELAEEIIKRADKKMVFCVPITEDLKKSYKIESGIDHGTSVPLHFINEQYKSFKVVLINYSQLSIEDHYRFGIAIKEASAALKRKIVIIASGDLSHRLTKEAPLGYSEKGEKFDTIFVNMLKHGDANGILDLPHDLCEGAGECGYRSLVILLGSLDGCEIKSDIISYEGPFGVGYCVAQVLFKDCKETGNTLDVYLDEKKYRVSEIRKNEDDYVRLARKSLESYVKYGRRIDVTEDIPEGLKQKQAGVFVSLKKNDHLRGCIGTIRTTRKNVAEEIIENAISAGTKDARFFPVEEEELEELIYSVDVLGEAEWINSKDELDVKKYGLIVESGNKSGLLLPNLEGVETVDEQIDIALSKANIKKSEKFSMGRFEVIRHH